MKRLIFVSMFLAGVTAIFAADFRVSINQPDGGMYHPGDMLEITLFSDTKCYFQIKHIDAENNTQVLYPVLPTDNMELPANKSRTVPGRQENNITFGGLSFGTETIMVTFSKTPVTPETDVAKANILATKQVSYKYEPFKLVMEFESPQEMLQAVKDDVVAAGRKVTGDEKKGTFETEVMTVAFEITGKQITFILPKDPALFNKPMTRGVSSQKPLPVALTIPPRELPARFDTAKQKILSTKGGAFNGDTSKGNFKTDEPLGGAIGTYEVNGSNVAITLSKYPDAPTPLVVGKIKGFFK